MMTTNELAKKWNMSAGTLANWRSQNRGPKFLRLGRKVVYKAESVLKFEKTNEASLTLKAPKKNRTSRKSKVQKKLYRRR